MKPALLALALLFQFPSVPVAPGPRGSIEGVVTGVDGAPVAGAEVTALWWPSPMAYSPNDLPRSTSDNEGRFVLRDIGAGGYRIQVRAPGYVLQEFGAASAGNLGSTAGTVLNLKPGEAIGGLSIRLVKEGILSGRITSTAGSPLLGMEVYAVRKRFDQNAWVTFVSEGTTGETNDRGEYRITGLPPGQYFVRASSQPLIGRGRTDTAPAPTPGEYPATYYPGAADSGNAVRVVVNAGVESANIDIALPRAPLFTIRGRIVDPTDSKPPTRPMLGATPARPEFVSVVGASIAPYKPDGTFEFPEIAPGTYWVDARLPGPQLTPEQRQLMSTPGADFSFPVAPQGTALVTVTNSDVENVEISIVRNLRVSGSVTVEGASLPPAELTAIQVQFRSISAGRMNPRPAGVTAISPDAHFTSGIISPGEYRVTLSGLPAGIYLKEGKLGDIDALSQIVTLTTSQAPPLDFVLAKGTELVGMVRDPASRAVPDQQVVLIPAFSNRPDLHRTVTTDGSGRFIFQGVAPGNYKVYAWKTLEPFQYFDPEFMREFADKGTPIHIEGPSPTTADVTLIN